MLTVGRVKTYMRHTLGGDLNANLDATALINQVGSNLVSMHTWKWLERPQAELDLRGTISVSAGTWTEASRTLSETGTFTNYTFLEGDQIAITSGTGATEQLYKVESRTGANAIVLKTSIGSGADGQTDIVGSMELDTVSLPSDLAEIIGYDATDSLINDLKMVTLKELLEMKTNQIPLLSRHYVGAIVWPEFNTATPAKSVPLLKIWPSPTSNDARELSIFYRAGWVDLTDDTDWIPIPDYVEALFIQLAQAWARGYEEEDNSSLSSRLMELENSPLLMAAKRRDGMLQPDYGPTRGGAVQTMPRGTHNFARSTVAGPS